MQAVTEPVAEANDFNASGYTVVREVFGAGQMELFKHYALLQQHYPDYYAYDKLTDSIGRYADAYGETLLLAAQPAIERASGLELLPCYSFLRIYRRGSALPKHTDRSSCEISASLTVGADAPGSWPLGVESGGEARRVDLAPGDLLVYKGADLPHWRERLESRFWVQLFLHYVDARGAYTDYKFDGRGYIGPFDPARQRRHLPPEPGR